MNRDSFWTVRERMSKYFETVNFWLENLLEKDSNFTIESNERGKMVEITINVDKNSIGKVIGKNGRIITSLRTLVSSIAKKEKKIIKIEVKDNN